MGKRIIQQARGKGSSTYRVRRKGYSEKIAFPRALPEKGKVVKLFTTAGHSAPLAKVSTKEGSFVVPAFNLMFEGQEFSYEPSATVPGSITALKHLPLKTPVYLIESRPGDGGKFVKAGGSSGVVNRIVGDNVFVVMPSKKEKKFNGNCRAVVGQIAGHGRKDKPFLKAGKKHYLMKSKGKLWPRTSAFKMNAIDHPFGSGRGKNPKPKIAKRNSAPGQKVGLLRPRQTGKRK